MPERKCIFCEKPVMLVGWVSIEPVYVHVGGTKQCEDLPSFALPEEIQVVNDIRARPGAGTIQQGR